MYDTVDTSWRGTHLYIYAKKYYNNGNNRWVVFCTILVQIMWFYGIQEECEQQNPYMILKIRIEIRKSYLMSWKVPHSPQELHIVWLLGLKPRNNQVFKVTSTSQDKSQKLKKMLILWLPFYHRASTNNDPQTNLM